jgi:hypothetical protein
MLRSKYESYEIMKKNQIFFRWKKVIFRIKKIRRFAVCRSFQCLELSKSSSKFWVFFGGDYS